MCYCKFATTNIDKRLIRSIIHQGLPIQKKHSQKFAYLEHMEIERFLGVHPSQLVVCICKTELITRCKPIDLVKPKARK